MPAIWIGGRNDPIVPIEEQRKTAALVPGARIYEFDCGHEIPARTLVNSQAIWNNDGYAHALQPPRTAPTLRVGAESGVGDGLEGFC